jgi:hypothetical protein
VRIKEHERAVLIRNVPEKGLEAGGVSTIVSVHGALDGGEPTGYTLESCPPPARRLLAERRA